VLSVWKLAAGQEAYYLNSVARGMEDYYVGGEAPGRWIAASDRLLGLNGTVRPDALHLVLSGRDPSTGARLGQPHRVPGFDLTFRAPKSVSVLFGLGDPDTARAVRDAHDRAVEAALEFAERHVVWSRRGHAGVEQIRGEGLIAAAFRHRTSRNADPHLHTHVLVPNMVLGVDGKWATLDGRWIYTSAKTVGYLYEAQLRHNLTETLEVGWGPVVNGIADISGIPQPVLKAFSTRRAEIEQQLEARGQYSAKAAMIAALDTRKAKDHSVDPIRLRDFWMRRAAEIGFDPESLRSVLRRTEPQPVDAARQTGIEDELLGREGLTAHESSFDRNDILRGWCDARPAGAPIGELERLADALVDRMAVARLTGVVPTRGPVIRDPTGKVLSSMPAGERWTTFELLNVEHAALETARGLLGRDVAVCEQRDVETALRTSPSLSGEQVRVVVEMTTSGNGIDILTAEGGAGKTFALATSRQAWERAGYRVIGAAHTGVAADELFDKTGIPSTTIARLLIAVHRGEPGGLDARTVLVVDEAGTAGTRDLAAIFTHADHAHTKVVLLGDPKQLPEIAAGGLFAGLIARQPVLELKDNHRQREEWERDALRQLRDGDPSAALAAYHIHGRITIGDTAEDTKALLVADWWASRAAGEDAIMLARRRSQVAELNVHGRLRAELAGRLTGAVLDVDGTPFQAGDAVMTLRNDRRIGVRNGNRGLVVAVDPDAHTMRVRLTRGDIDLPARYVDAGCVCHAYAMTVNKAHGLTCDRTMTRGDDQIYRELAYEALSRGRLSNHVYMPRSCIDLDQELPHARTVDTPDPMEMLEQGLRRSHAKQLALDQMATIPLQAWTTSDLLTERDRIRSVLNQAPPDRSRDLDALIKTRRSAVSDLKQANLNVARLDCRKRPLRDRRKPDIELIHANNQASQAQDRLDRLNWEITDVQAGQHRRHSHLAAHRADALQLDAIDHVLTERIRTTVVRDVTDPPTYITRALGPRPTDRQLDREWVTAVVAIDTYRTQHDVTDRRTTIGQQPTGHAAQLDWYAVRDKISVAQDQLGIATPEPRRPSMPEIELPTLDIGL
jgi:conjugative relaxase-like TrwC/TraI family protein